METKRQLVSEPIVLLLISNSRVVRKAFAGTTNYLKLEW